MTLLQVDKDVFRKFLLLYVDAMRSMETEVIVYRTVTEVLKQYAPDGIEKLTAKMRENPEMKDMLDKKYGQYRNLVLESIEKGSLDQALSQFLQEWKAKGPIN